MNRIIKSIIFGGALLCATSCYEDYISDYEYPNMGFALTRQVRTVVSGNNTIYVGVSIGGKREVDMDDWAKFTLEESLLDGTGLTMLPDNYYNLSDKETMRPRKSNLAVADVGITFTDDFYNDLTCLKNTYALPLRIVSTSIPEKDNPNGAIREGGETAIVVIKFISGYSGTYYRVGQEVEVDEQGNEIGEPVEYNAADLIKNPTCALSTVSRYCVTRPGLGTSTGGGLNLHITETESTEAYTVRLESVKGGGELMDFTARYVISGDYTFYSGDEIAPQFELDYSYSLNGKFYKVSEKLVLRQWPERELKVETF